MRLSLLPFVLLGLPIAEIAVFILVGRHIGLLPTLGLIFLTAILGSLLLRVQGLGTLMRIQQVTQSGHVPGRELIHGVMILFAGILLITPGFITDTLGFLLFVPAVRDRAWRLLKDRIVVLSARGPRNGGWRPTRGQRPGPAGPPVIDLERDDFERKPDPDSPWSNEPDRPSR